MPWNLLTIAAFPPGVATLQVIDEADHNSVSDAAESWDALVDSR